MSDDTLQRIELTGSADYIAALNTICGLAKRSLCVFEKDYVNIGFNCEARFEQLRGFLLDNPDNRLQLLAHDTRPISQNCPRLMTLLRQFSHNMFIYQTPRNLQHLTAPFAVADGSHYVRRFHFDDSRGILARNDGEKARLMKSRFSEMWAASHPGASTSTFSL
ncbi:MAG TPA: hypothetical protein VMV48_15690 [Gallionellaceae bacterium]|nr:hypothetical protein [Gallionellaceae bacterium]